MKKRYISLQTNESKGTYAIYKAREDVNRIVKSCGYKTITLESVSHFGLWRVIKRHLDIFSLKFRLNKEDAVFFQFPWIHNNKPEFYANLFGSGAKTQCIIHDLDSLRGIDKSRYDEISALKCCNKIIAHTPKMKQFLTDSGIENDKIDILYTFPYSTNDPLVDTGAFLNNRIIFAGNLSKSAFLGQLTEIANNNTQFNLYGNGFEAVHCNDFIHYKGTFSPDHPGDIEGNWGLVWDGSSLDTCDGKIGNYLRYNSSHKISLYLAMGIPVILWKESSLKDFIEQNDLGITVSSLHELNDILTNLPAERIETIRAKCKSYASVVRNGENLKRLIRR